MTLTETGPQNATGSWEDSSVFYVLENARLRVSNSPSADQRPKEEAASHPDLIFSRRFMEMSPSLYILSLRCIPTRNHLHTLNTEILESVNAYSLCGCVCTLLLECGGQR